MYRIHIKLNHDMKAPFKLLNELNNDWTHFPHLHRKTIAGHRLLYKDSSREIFLYKSRCLYPLPIYEYYVVFRDYPTPQSYRNVYVNTKTGHANYLHAEMTCHGEMTTAVARYLFTLPWYWRFFPKLFFGIFKKRMQKILDEDNEWVYGRMTSETETTSPACAPVVPETYDPLEIRFDEKLFSTADTHFEYRVTQLFEDKKRWLAPARETRS